MANDGSPNGLQLPGGSAVGWYRSGRYPRLPCSPRPACRSRFGPRAAVPRRVPRVSSRVAARRSSAATGSARPRCIEILIGMQEPDEGEVHRPQGPAHRLPAPGPARRARTGRSSTRRSRGAGHITGIAHRLEELAHRLADVDDPDHDQLLAAYGEAQTRFEQLGGYALEAEAQRVLAGLGFDDADRARPVKELSGGWRMRVALARTAGRPARPADPRRAHQPPRRRHVAWLEQHLAGCAGALLFVSHDRDFIDSVANQVLELAGGRSSSTSAGSPSSSSHGRSGSPSSRRPAASQARQIAPRRAVRGALPLQGHQGPPGAEPAQGAGPHRAGSRCPTARS